MALQSVASIQTTTSEPSKAEPYSQAELARIDAFLAQMLQSHGVDTSAWGTANFRSIADLRRELGLGMSAFKLVRECSVIRLDVRYQHPEQGALKLFETRQDFFLNPMPPEERRACGDYQVGRSRCRASDFAVWEKFTPGAERVEDAKVRALREELKLGGRFNFTGSRFLEEWEEPEDYPLIDTLLLVHEDTVWLTREQYEQCTNECQHEKRTIFEWRPAGTDPAEIRRQFAAEVGNSCVHQDACAPPAGQSPLDTGLGVAGARDIFERMRINELGGRLVGHAVPIDKEWGRDRAKTARHLLEELDLGESRLPPMRYCNVVWIEVLADRGSGIECLCEADRRFLDGPGEARGGARLEIRPGLWRRFPFGQDPLVHAQNALRLKLGLDQTPYLEDRGPIDEREQSIDYPNLCSRLHGRAYRAILAGSHVKPYYIFREGPVETRFEWRRLGEHRLEAAVRDTP